VQTLCLGDWFTLAGFGWLVYVRGLAQ
jgi:hypothetical protein